MEPDQEVHGQREPSTQGLHRFSERTGILLGSDGPVLLKSISKEPLSIFSWRKPVSLPENLGEVALGTERQSGRDIGIAGVGVQQHVFSGLHPLACDVV